MDRKRLEIMLQRVPHHPSPDPALEQYATPAPLAATLLFDAAMQGDMEGRSVADLGCGTGILSIGAALLGASRVLGIDIDGASLEVAREAASGLGVDVDFEMMDVADLEGAFDTVVMNPPFGAQRRGADRPFLQKAIEVASVIHGIHNGPTVAFVRSFLEGSGFVITHLRELELSIPHMHDFHEKERRAIPVALVRSERRA
ncbi:MAG: METTL5 family protein [Thermoplasmata archaeon]|nr:METTL5 family protein [Thermoplasmata archaeon]